MFYDVSYISPSGAQGTHHAVEADCIQDAVALSPVMLSYNSDYLPEDFTITAVVPSVHFKEVDNV